MLATRAVNVLIWHKLRVVLGNTSPFSLRSPRSNALALATAGVYLLSCIAYGLGLAFHIFVVFAFASLLAFALVFLIVSIDFSSPQH